MIISYLNERRYATFAKEIPIPYNREITPANTSVEDFLKDHKKGANCQLTTLGIANSLGFHLPNYLRSLELYFDNTFTKRIKKASEIATGDILGLCSQEQGKFRFIHVGIAHVEDGQVNILHNAKSRGYAVIEPLSEAQKKKEHEVLAWIRRPKIKIPTLVNHEVLNRLDLAKLAE